MKENEKSENKLIDGIWKMFSFNGLSNKKIENIESNCGTVWFKIDDQDYYISIQECEVRDE